MYILVTGGLGYIGSHIVVELLNNNYHVIIIDNLSNSNVNIFYNIAKICNEEILMVEKNKIVCNNVVLFIDDIDNSELLNNIFYDFFVSHVIHLSAFKSVNESIDKPLLYYDNNISKTINLLKIMEKHYIKNFIFSSSATVYGNNKSPFYEYSQTGVNITNPYGKSKYIIEEILKDLKNFNMWCLRYFNPIGCHESGLIGDNPNGIPSNLMPYIIRVSIGLYDKLNIFGNDYKTNDGTCERDFIHVVDLARAHVKALENMHYEFNVLNIGTGKPISVLTLVRTFEQINNVKINYEFKEKREGNIDVSYCDASLAEKLINWKAELNIEDMCRDSYNYALQFL